MRMKKRILAFMLLAAIGSSSAIGNDWNDDFPPSPTPFSLNSYDVIQAVQMIKRVRFLQFWDYESSPVTLVAHDIYSVHVGFDNKAFEEHRHRYTVMINGQPLDWDHTYIEYGTQMVNLRLLFTYRNQQPIPEIPYTIDYSG